MLPKRECVRAWRLLFVVDAGSEIGAAQRAFVVKHMYVHGNLYVVHVVNT